MIPDSASKNVKAWYRRCFDSMPPDIPAYCPGDPGVFHSRCQAEVLGHMAHSSVYRTRTQISCRSAPHILATNLTSVNG